MIVLLLQSDQEVVDISGIFSTVLETFMADYQTYVWSARSQTHTWHIAIEFLRAVFSLFRALKENLLAITTGI